MSTDIGKMPDIDKMTDEDLDKFLESVELKCKVDPKTSKMVCPTTEEVFKALAKLKKPVTQLVFEVTSEPITPVTE